MQKKGWIITCFVSGILMIAYPIIWNVFLLNHMLNISGGYDPRIMLYFITITYFYLLFYAGILIILGTIVLKRNTKCLGFDFNSLAKFFIRVGNVLGFIGLIIFTYVVINIILFADYTIITIIIILFLTLGIGITGITNAFIAFHKFKKKI